MSNIWFTSDTHYWHEAVLQFCPNTRKGKNAEEMTEIMIENHNKVVKPGDTVIHAGDFSFGGVAKVSSLRGRLSGQIHLCFGNHDKLLQKKKDLHDMFASIQTRKHFKAAEHHFIIDHFPLSEWENAHHGWIMIHGHQHGSGQGVDKRYKIMDVGVDTRSDNLMIPYHIDEVLTLMKDREILPHHGQIKE